MARVEIKGEFLDIKLSMVDQLLPLIASFRIPLSHVTNAYESSLAGLELRSKVVGANLGFVKTAGVYENAGGLILCDLRAGRCLVIETHGERFPRIAVQLANATDPDALAREILRAVHSEPMPRSSQSSTECPSGSVSHAKRP
jgi:hypothetical protein